MRNNTFSIALENCNNDNSTPHNNNINRNLSNNICTNHLSTTNHNTSIIPDQISVSLSLVGSYPTICSTISEPQHINKLETITFVTHILRNSTKMINTNCLKDSNIHRSTIYRRY